MLEISKYLKMNSKQIILKGNEYFSKDEYNDAIEYHAKALAIEPGDADALYNKACSKVKNGDIDNGLADLRRSMELDRDKFIKLAKEDKDFDSIRNDERFKALIASFLS